MIRGHPGKGFYQFLLICGVLAALAALRVLDPVPVAYLRLLVFDIFQQFNPRNYDPDTPVRIIDIDEASLAKLGQWPWPRSVMADLVTKATKLGASAIALDIAFSEPDRLSPDNFLKYYPPSPARERIRDAAKNLPDNDQVFARAIAKAPTVLGLTLTNSSLAKVPEIKAGFATAGDMPGNFAVRFSGAIALLAPFARVAKGIGALNWSPDRDQILRRIPIIYATRGKLVPGLAAEALRVAQGAGTYIVKSSGASGETGFGAKTGIVSVRIGGFNVPTDRAGQMWMWFTKSRKERYLPAWKLLAGQINRKQIEGRILIVGSSAAGLQDLKSTPLAVGVPGVEGHAQAIEQITSGAFIYRPDYADGLELVLIILAGLGLGLILIGFGPQYAGVLALLAIAAAIGGAWLAFVRWHWLIDPLYPSLSIFAVYLAGTVFAYVTTERERRRVRMAFGRYLSPGLVEELAENTDRLKLGGESRDLTLMFSDIRGFTELSEGLSSENLVELMNRYLKPMTEIVFAHKGTLDKYMGDAIMVFWNAPMDDPDHARNGCLAALSMLQALDALNEDLRLEALVRGDTARQIKIGIGLNTGPCHVGNFGSELRYDYSVIGDNVNVASRLEGQTKFYGVPVILGEKTALAVPELPKLELDLVRVKGKANPERIFALAVPGMANIDQSFKELADPHTGLLAAYRNHRWRDAAALLRRCRTLSGPALHTYYDIMAVRIAAFKRRAPPRDWDGVFDAKSK